MLNQQTSFFKGKDTQFFPNISKFIPTCASSQAKLVWREITFSRDISIPIAEVKVGRPLSPAGVERGGREGAPRCSERRDDPRPGGNTDPAAGPARVERAERRGAASGRGGPARSLGKRHQKQSPARPERATLGQPDHLASRRRHVADGASGRREGWKKGSVNVSAPPRAGRGEKRRAALPANGLGWERAEPAG